MDKSDCYSASGAGAGDAKEKLFRKANMICCEIQMDISSCPGLTKCFAERRHYGTRACLQVFEEDELKLQTIVRLKSREDLSYLKFVFSSLRDGLNEHVKELDKVWDSIGRPSKVRKVAPTSDECVDLQTQDLKLHFSDSE